MRKKLLLAAIICLVVSVIFIVPTVVGVVEYNLSQEHYEATAIDDGYGKEYGCGENSCKYCNGKSGATTPYAFVYSCTMSDIFIASVSIVAVFAAGSLALFISSACVGSKK